MDVLQSNEMSNTLTIRLPEELLEWLRDTSERTGVPVGRLVRDQLETAKSDAGNQRFMRHAGTFTGPKDLSARKGYSRR